MATQELQPGTILADSYEIVRQVARGGMGDVYEARHMRLAQRRVAIKVLRIDDRDKHEEIARRFRREAEICAKLIHPNVVQVTDWNSLPDGAPYFVMEYLEGESLDARMRRRRLTPPQVEHILEQVGSALHTAHQLDIVHRDLKPSNIFLASNRDAPLGPEFVKVLDFGISKILGGNTLQTTGHKVLGSPRYMSPEQARGRNQQITVRSDQFTLGVVAYELYSGKPPFDAETLDSLLFNIVYEEPPPLREVAPEVPEHVAAAIERAMNKQAGDRYPSIRDFLRDLLQDPTYLRAPLGHGVSPEAVTTRARPVSGTGRHLRIAIGFAAVLAIAAIGAFTWRWMAGSEEQDALRAIDDVSQSQPDQQGRAPAGEPADGDQPGNRPEQQPGGQPGNRPEQQPGNRPDQQPGDQPEQQPGDQPDQQPGDQPGNEPATGSSGPPPAGAPGPSAEVLEKLEQAQALFDSGQYRQALRPAMQSIGIQDTPGARRLIALCYCGMRDLEMANASMHKVAAHDEAAVRRRCRELGIDW